MIICTLRVGKVALSRARKPCFVDALWIYLPLLTRLHGFLFAHNYLKGRFLFHNP